MARQLGEFWKRTKPSRLPQLLQNSSSRIHQAELSICTLPSGQHQEFLILGPIATSWLAKRGSGAYFLPFLENDVSYYSLQKNDKIA